MSDVIFEIVIIFALIVVNGVLAMSEIAIVSARKARLLSRAEEGDHRARAALELANHPNRFLSTVQIGITLVGIFAGAYGGANVSDQLALALRTYGPLEPYADALALGLVVMSITFLSLIVGELVPKRIGMHSPERIASAMARPMRILSIVMAPLVHLLGMTTDFVLHLLRLKTYAEEPVTEEEVSLLIEQGTRAGVFAEEEQDLVERVFRFADQTAGELMTPRVEIVALDVQDPVEINRQKLGGQTHARFIVCEGGLDNVLGFIHVKDILAQSLQAEHVDILAVLRHPHFLPDSVSALRVLELFRSSGVHLALVVDEYGGIAGLVTLDDILEAIVGDIPWVGETAEPAIIGREDGSYLVDGMLLIDEFKDAFDIKSLPNEDNGSFRTLGGFVVTHLGRIPSVAEAFDWDRFHIEVVDMDGNRVDKVMIRATPRAEA